MAESRPSFFRRYVFLFVGIAGAVFSTAAYFVTAQSVRLHVETEFYRRADIRHTLTREILNYYEAGLFGLRSLYIGSGDVTHAEFDRVAGEIVARNPGISALEWVPVVPDGQRAAFEAAISAELHRPVSIMAFNGGARLLSAPPKPEYAPVLFVHPAAGRESVIGFDITSGRIAGAVARARAERRMIVSPAVKLIEQPNRNRSGVTWIWPVYQRDPDAAVPTGYLLGVFNVPEMLDESLRRHSATVLEALYLDPTEPDPAQRIFYFQTSGPAPTHEPWPTEAEFRRGHLVREQPLPIGGKTWRVLYRPRPEWTDELDSAAPNLLLASGLLFSFVAAGWIFQQSRRATLVERLVAERTAELTESRRELGTFLHELPGMAYRATFDDKFDIIFMSDGAEPLTGHAPDEFLSLRLHPHDIIHPDDLGRVQAATRAGLETRGEIEVEHRIRTRDGREKWVLSRGRAVFTAGQPPVFEGLSIDITAQKLAEFERLALERKLLEGQKLESLGLLAGGIAHDFNNLLTGVLGNAGLARHALPAGAPVEPQLRAIEQAALRAAELCRQMLAYAGKGRFIVEPVELSALVEGVLPLLNISLARRAELRLELTRDLPAVQADATQLRQIVMNLVLNAADAIGDRGGTITLTTGVMRADAVQLRGCAAGAELPEGDYVFLEVRDTGGGMTPEVVAKIFDPFFTTKFAGRGLGLAAVLGIVRGHQGALRVESTPGQGSSFRLLLPPSVIRGGLPPVASAADTGWHRAGQVLVIEDEADVRIVVAEMLQTLGLTPRVAADGHTGLAAFRENPAGCDVVLLDLLMPGLSGEETLQALRAIRPDVRVILMSGYNEGNLLRRLASERGSLAFLPKPFTRAALIEKLRALLG